MTIDSQIRNYGASIMNDPAFRTRVDFNQYLDPTIYPPRIRAAAQEAIARRLAMAEYIRSLDVEHYDWDVLHRYVVDSSDAEDNLLQLIRVWQNDALMERTSAPMWMDNLEDPTWDEVK